MRKFLISTLALLSIIGVVSASDVVVENVENYYCRFEEMTMGGVGGLRDWLYDRGADLLYFNDNIDQVLIGGSSTSSEAILEVSGNFTVDTVTSTVTVDAAQFCIGGANCITSWAAGSNVNDWYTDGDYMYPSSTKGLIISASSTIEGNLNITGNTTSTNATTTNLYVSNSLTVNTDVNLPNNSITDAMVSDTLTVTAYMQDEDINTFSELQSWVSDKTLMNEEDIFTIDANWVNTANPWADAEVADDITVSNYLPLAGGSLTGAATGTFLYMSGDITSGGIVTSTSGYNTQSDIHAGGNLTVDGNSTTTGHFYINDYRKASSSYAVYRFATSSLDYETASTATTTKEYQWVGHPTTLRHVYCKTNDNNATIRIGDGSNWSPYITIDNTGSLTALTSNNTFTAYEDIHWEVGNRTMTQELRCTLEFTFD